jgi:hypothetical protein
MRNVLKSLQYHSVPRSNLIAVILLLVLVTVTTACDSLPTWTYINDTPYAIEVFTNNASGPYRANERVEVLTGFPEDVEKWTVKAYKFVPGEGRRAGFNAQGTLVPGSFGDLIFCRVYTREELKKADLTIVITQNVDEKGLRPDPKTPTCP